MSSSYHLSENVTGIPWNGDRLGERLAITIEDGRPASDAFEGRPLLMGASTGKQAVVLQPGEIGPFLRCHREEWVSCFNAGRLLSTLKQERGAYSELRSLARNCRLHDVQQLDLLLFEASSSFVPPAPRPFDDLFKVWIDDRDNGRGEGEETRGQPLGKAWADCLAEFANCIHMIYCCQLSNVSRWIDELELDVETVMRFGPLSVGIQTQGAIALSRPEDIGIAVNPNKLAFALRDLEKRYEQLSSEIGRNPRAHPCFRWVKKRIRRTALGLPDQKQPRLEDWLATIVETHPGRLDIPHEVPRTSKGAVSVRPEFWGDLVRVHPLLRAWSALWATASAIASLECGTIGPGVVPLPRYSMLPRLTSQHPNFTRISPNELAGLFKPQHGCQLFFLEFPNLVLNCVERIMFFNSGFSPLIMLRGIGEDLVQHFAGEFYARSLAQKPGL